jgi:hypothetical protein
MNVTRESIDQFLNQINVCILKEISIAKEFFV